MHPHPQDGSPGSFPDAGCYHLGLIGIRTCGSYGNVNAIRLYLAIGLEMHPHPEDGSPGSFADAGCVTYHLGLIGIRTCGSYGNVNAIRLYQYQANRY